MFGSLLRQAVVKQVTMKKSSSESFFSNAVYRSRTDQMNKISKFRTAILLRTRDYAHCTQNLHDSAAETLEIVSSHSARWLFSNHDFHSQIIGIFLFIQQLFVFFHSSFLPIFLSSYFPIFLSPYLSFFLSFFLPIFLSIYLSFFGYTLEG